MYIYLVPDVVGGDKILAPLPRVLDNGMSDASGSNSNSTERVTMASVTTLMPPQSDFAQATQTQVSAKDEQAREDEEWLENPMHPRNWPPRKKWLTMAIVSRSPPGPF